MTMTWLNADFSMPDANAEDDLFNRITQVIGVAYTFLPSRAARRYLTRDNITYHSSKTKDFSYFFKGNKDSIGRNRDSLHLRTDPSTGCMAKHWPEPELAAILGDTHQIVAYTLANDLTAIDVEARGRSTHFDGTYYGKVWDRSGSIGPKFVLVGAIEVSHLDIGLTIRRENKVIYDQSYNMSRRVRSLDEIPDRIVELFGKFRHDLPLSKRITVENGYLPSGTLIMLGTGIVVRPQYYCLPGDEITVYCSPIGELVNTIL